MKFPDLVVGPWGMYFRRGLAAHADGIGVWLDSTGAVRFWTGHDRFNGSIEARDAGLAMLELLWRALAAETDHGRHLADDTLEKALVHGLGFVPFDHTRMSLDAAFSGMPAVVALTAAGSVGEAAPAFLAARAVDVADIFSCELMRLTGQRLSAFFRLEPDPLKRAALAGHLCRAASTSFTFREAGSA